MLHFTSGDMFELDVDIRVNTVNCVGVMGAGVALAFKTRYPEMFREYKKVCDANELKPGALNVWRTLTEWIVNFPTKRHWRENSKYEDLEDGLRAFRRYLEGVGRPVRVALPALGCGHGGLDWSQVSKLIERHLGSIEADIFVFEPGDSIRAGELATPAKGAKGKLDVRPTIVRSDEFAFPAPLRSIDVQGLALVGDSACLVDPMVFITGSEVPDAREEAAALQCVEALARTGTQLCFLITGTIWGRLAKMAVSRGANVLLWCIEPIQPASLKSLHGELNEGRVAVVSLSLDHEVWSQRTHDRTRRAAIEIAHALLVTDAHPEWVLANAIPKEHGVFFVRYGASTTDTEKLLALGARPIGRKANSKEPNVAPIVSALRPAPSAIPAHRE